MSPISKSCKDFSLLPAKPEALHWLLRPGLSWGLPSPVGTSPFTTLPSHSITATMGSFLFLKCVRAHSHPSGSLYLLYWPSSTLLPHTWHAPSLPSESNVIFSRRPFLIKLFKRASLLPQPCHSLTCFIYLHSITR